MAKTSALEIPYDSKGNLLHYPDPDYITRTGPVWQQNDPFLGMTLKFSYMARGRSAAYSVWNDYHGHSYPMFMTDLGEILERCTIRNGSVCADWIVKKRGQNYGTGLYHYALF